MRALRAHRAPGTPTAGRREWIGLAVLALPRLSAALEAGSTQQLRITDIYGFLVGGLLVTMGALGDRIGRRRLLLLGAAVFGVAPLNHDSGSARGKRLIWGGRARVRSAPHMGVLSAVRYNPALRACYTRLREQGKLPKVALVACMHKLLTILNAIFKHQTPWQPTCLA